MRKLLLSKIRRVRAFLQNIRGAMQREVRVQQKMLNVWVSCLHSNHIKKELHQHSSESCCVLSLCKLHNLVYIDAAVLIDWINWLHRALHGTVAPVWYLYEQTGPLCHYGEKTACSSLSEFTLYSNSAVTQMTSEAPKHRVIFSPVPTAQSQCEKPSCFVSTVLYYHYLTGVCQRLKHLLRAAQEKKKRIRKERTTPTPKNYCIYAPVSCLCIVLWFEAWQLLLQHPTPVSAPPHYFSACSRILLFSCNHPLSICWRISCVSVVS